MNNYCSVLIYGLIIWYVNYVLLSSATKLQRMMLLYMELFQRLHQLNTLMSLGGTTISMRSWGSRKLLLIFLLLNYELISILCFSIHLFDFVVVFLEKGAVSLWRDLLPSLRRQLQLLLLVTQRQVYFSLFWLFIYTSSCLCILQSLHLLPYFGSIGRDVYLAPRHFLEVNLGVFSWQVLTTSACCRFLLNFRDFFKRL